MTHVTPNVAEVLTVVMAGDLDGTTVAGLRRRLTVALDVGRGFAVVHLVALHVRGEETMRLFRSALEQAKRRGARLAIAAAHPDVRGELERRAGDGVELYPTLSAAVAAAGHTRRATEAARQGGSPADIPFDRPGRHVPVLATPASGAIPHSRHPAARPCGKS